GTAGRPLNCNHLTGREGGPCTRSYATEKFIQTNTQILISSSPKELPHMAHKWSNLDLPVFTHSECCKIFSDQLQTLSRDWPSKLIPQILLLVWLWIVLLAVGHDSCWPEDSESCRTRWKRWGVKALKRG